MFKDNLYALRRNKKLTSEELATALGIEKDTYEKLELGFAEPDYLVLKKLSSYYGVEPTALLNDNLAASSSKTTSAAAPTGTKGAPYFSRKLAMALVIFSAVLLLASLIVPLTIGNAYLFILCALPLFMTIDAGIVAGKKANIGKYRIFSRILQPLLAIAFVVASFCAVDGWGQPIYYYAEGFVLEALAVLYLALAAVYTIIGFVKEYTPKEGARKATVIQTKDGTTKKTFYLSWATITNMAISVALLIMFFAVPLASGSIDFGFGSLSYTAHLYDFLSSGSGLFVMTAVIMLITTIYAAIESLIFMTSKEVRNSAYRIVGRVLNTILSVLTLILFVACIVNLSAVNAQIIIVIALLVALVAINITNLIICTSKEK